MTRKIVLFIVFCAMGAVFFNPPRAAAQANQQCLQQVMDLNKKAMEAFAGLEIDTAKQYIEQAIGFCSNPQCGLSAGWQAKTYMNYGIILVAGFQDTTAGMNAFMTSLKWNPQLQLDVMYSSPDIQMVFNLARKQVGSTTVPTPTPTPVPTPVPTPTPTPYPTPTPTPYPTPTPAPGYEMKMTRHTHVTEQLYGYPIPIYVEINPAISASVGNVFLFFRAPGEANYQKQEMTKLTGMEAYGTKLDCDFIINPPSYEYYIMVASKDGTPLAFEPQGGMQTPLTMKYVQMLAGTPPTMGPMSPPEQKCKQNPDICFSDAECLENFKCWESMCVIDEDAKKGKKKKRRGGAGGAGFIAADLLFAFGFGIVKGDAYCGKRNMGGGTMKDPKYCQELKSAGFSMSGPALRLSLSGGYFVLGNFAIGIGAYFRYQFMSGDVGTSPLRAADGAPLHPYDLHDNDKNNLSIGGKLVLLVTAGKNDEWWINIGVGAGYTKMRHKIDNMTHPYWCNQWANPDNFNDLECAAPDNEPLLGDGVTPNPDYHGYAEKKSAYWRLAGSTGLLLPEILVSYRFLDWMGIVFGVSSEFVVYDRFAWNIDVTVGIQFGMPLGNKGKKKKKKKEDVSEEPFMD